MSAEGLLRGFVLDRVLNEDARTKSANLLGHFDVGEKQEQAIVIMEKVHFSPSFYERLDPTHAHASIAHFQDLGANDVYSWLLAWTPFAADPTSTTDAHVKLTVIRPATEAHVIKYTDQERLIVTETPSMYANVVGPWIDAQPVERIQWVYNILDKKKEADTILFEQKDEFIIVPDLKWDRKTLSSLYLVAIVHDRSLRSLRDLTQRHVPLLRSILRQAQVVAKKHFGLQAKDGLSKVRCFIHYQPTYYHLHVHILSADYTSHPGAIVAQAHLLEDVIDLLELGVDFAKRTLTYTLGERSPLLAHIRSHGNVTI